MKSIGTRSVWRMVALFILFGSAYFLSTLVAPKNVDSASTSIASSPPAASLTAEAFPQASLPTKQPDASLWNTAYSALSKIAPSELATDDGRIRCDRIIAEATRGFDLELAAYIKAATAANRGKKIVWKQYISDSPRLNADQRKKNLTIWKHYLFLCQKLRELQQYRLYKVRWYIQFFDVDSFALPAEKRALLPVPEPWDDVPFGYITEVIDPAWFASYVDVSNDFDFNTYQAKIDMDPHIRAIQDAIDKRTSQGFRANKGIRMLLGYDKHRAEDLGGQTIRAISKHMDMQGKDVADIGAGSGFILPIFRSAIGPKAKLYAGDLDEFTLDVLQYTSKGTDTVVYRCELDDVCLGENAFDILNMTGVHAGMMSEDHPRTEIEKHFLPWIRSMATALRPGGLLVLHDNHMDIRERRVDKIIEEAGFEKIDEIITPDNHTFIWIFRVKK